MSAPQEATDQVHVTLQERSSEEEQDTEISMSASRQGQQHLLQSEDAEMNKEKLKMNLARCNWYEVLIAVSSGLIFIGLHYVPGKIKNALFIAAIAVGYGSYVVYKMKCYGYRVIIHDWGLTFTNFKITFYWCTAVALCGVLVMLMLMASNGTGLPFHYDLVLMFLLYPIWGVIQQFLIQAMIAINLTKYGLNYYAVIFLTACSFTLVHWPEWLLMLATFCVGLTFTPIFLKYKCLYPLGLYHGWCGALFYWLVLDEDPMQRF